MCDMRRLTVLVLLGVALPAGAAAAATPPILYDRGNECPAHVTCTGKPLYNVRIRRIVKVGFPSIPLPTGAFSDSQPAWSPDHKRIAFVRESRNGLSYTIWVMNANGTGQKQITKGNRGDASPDWSPDGKRIVFRGNSPDRRTFDLYSVGAGGTGLVDITRNPDNVGALSPDWSPNGKLIVFRRTRAGSGIGTGIYTTRPDGTGLKRLRIGGLDPAWSPTGGKVAFTLPDPRSGGQIQIFLMNANGSGSTRLTRGAETVSPAWSPGGAQIVCVRGNQITVITVKTGAIKQLTRPLTGLAFVADPAW